MSRADVAVRVEEARKHHAAGLVALFDRAGSSCFCRYWHFQGDKNAWLDRCANAPTDSRHELENALRTGSDEARGLVALGPVGEEADAVVGWIKVAPAASVPKLYDQKLYRKLPCFSGDRAGVFTIGCLLVDPSHRRSGVARALIAGAVRVAPSWGARALEAFPRRPREAVRDEELWTGPAALYFEQGFVEVHEFEPYPVLRRDVSEASR